MVRLMVLACALCCLVACDKSATPGAKHPEDSAYTPPDDSAALPKDSPAQTTSTSAGDSSQSPTAGATADVEVLLANHAQLLERVAQFKGRVVVVDVWANSCLPCKKEFPHLIELARRWPEDVVCISMNIDYIGLSSEPPESCLPKVKRFLISQSARADNLVNLASSEADEEVIKKLEIGSMPAILIFDRAGQQVAKLTTDTAGPDGLTYAGDVIPAVEKLVEQR